MLYILKPYRWLLKHRKEYRHQMCVVSSNDEFLNSIMISTRLSHNGNSYNFNIRWDNVCTVFSSMYMIIVVIEVGVLCRPAWREATLEDISTVQMSWLFAFKVVYREHLYNSIIRSQLWIAVFIGKTSTFSEFGTCYYTLQKWSGTYSW